MAAESTEQLLDLMPFARTVGIDLVEVGADRVVGRLEWAPERCTSAEVMHGGALMVLADTCGAVCAVQHLPEGAGTSTIESKTNFFRGLRGGSVTATSVPLHAGRTTIVVQTEMRDGDGKLIAMTTQTQAVLQR